MLFVNKLKVLTLMTCLMLVGQAFGVEKWTDEAVEPPKVSNVYQVSTPGQLAWFAKESIGKGISHKIKLVADLDLKGKLWLPIAAGFDKPGFNGQFDGDGHTISNLYIRGEELLEEYTLIKDVKGKKLNCIDQNIGLFGVNGGGSIKNLNLENINIYATNDQSGCGNEISVGGLVGWKTPIASTIENVVVSGKIYTSGKGQGVGGIVGNAHSSSISNSVSKVNITADGDNAFVGGIVGLVKNNEVKITSCVYAGEDLESNGNGGTLGAVVGKVYNGDKTNANLTDVYYDYDIFGDNAVGLVVSPAQTTGNPSPVSDLNNEEVICKLNKGTLDANGECDKQKPWSVGGQSISWNGSDGFKVTFDADGGTFPENSKTYKMLSKGNTITADEIASPTKVGAAFAGWSLTKGASEHSDLGTATKPTRVYAVWNPIFTITFDANDGSFPDGSTTKKKNVALNDVITVEGIGALPETYCKVSSTLGCDVTMYFTGWSFIPNPSKESEIVDLNNLNIYATENTTLYAVWTEVITYTVTFNANEHGKTKVNFVRVEADGNITQPVDPSADEGYHFDGWFTENGNKFGFDTTAITESIILYAHWTPVDYTITYELEENGTNNPDNRSTYNVETPTFEFAAPTREGYTFVKWYYDENFSSPATQITQGTTTGHKTLYAKWEANVYTITYRVGSVGHGTVLPSEKKHGKAINLKLTNDGFERPGYTQTGWSTTDGGEKVYESGASYTENHDLELFPTWGIATYTITYVCEVCTESNPSKPRTYTINDTKNGNLSIYNPTFASSEYDFVGWYWDKNYTQRTTNIPKGTLGDTTLYGKMLKKYTIEYKLNGGTKANSRTSYTSETATFALGQATGREGYTFAGWYDNPAFAGNPVTEVPLGSTGDKTFYAKWIRDASTISVVAKSQVFEYDGNSHKAECEIAADNPWGYTITATTDDLVTDVQDGEVSASCNVVIMDGDEDITASFEGFIESVPGTISVVAKAVPYGAVTIYTDETGSRAVIDGNYDGMESAIIPENIKVSSVTFERNFPKGKYSTIFLPFSIPQTKVEGGVFHEFAYVDLEKMQVAFRSSLAKSGGIIEANTPYIFEATDNQLTFNLEGEDFVTLEPSAEAVARSVSPEAPYEEDGKWEFRGVYSYKQWQEGDAELGAAYGFAAASNPEAIVGKFKRLGAGAYIKPMRAYLFNTQYVSEKSSGPSLAKRARASMPVTPLELASVPESMDIVIIDDESEETTVIGKLNTTTGEIKVINNWYDMKGRKLNAKPKAKGIYYFNGKRVIVK